MDNEPFEASKLKIKRATRHTEELREDIRSFMRRKPFVLRIEDGGSGQHNWTIRVRRQIPKEFSAIIGDVLHNLRAALDLLACDLVRLNGGNDKDVYFPFCNSVDDLDETIRKRKIDRAASDVVDLIRSFKPYKGGNVALRAIHDLDIMDKHKALIPTAEMMGLPNFTSAALTFTNNRIGPIRDGMVAIRMPAASKLRVGQELEGKFHLLFPFESAFNGSEVIPTLQELTELVSGIIETFEAHCYGGESEARITVTTDH
jgi:hypothetical protein